MRRLHLVGGVVLVVVTAAVPTVDWAYRTIELRRLAGTQQSVRAVHRNSLYTGRGMSRFGRGDDHWTPSLVEDFRAWADLKLGRGSALEAYFCRDYSGLHAYALMDFHFEHEGKSFSHSFIWSPGRMEFVPFQACRPCSAQGCP